MRLCGAVQRADQKLQSIMTADNRLRVLAIPVPIIPSPFLGLLPVKSEKDLSSVEQLLACDNDKINATKFKEKLECYNISIVKII